MEKYIVGNWKMNLGDGRGLSLLKHLATLKIFPGVRVVVCPPALLLREAHHTLSPGLALGAQDVSAHPGGAFTGEISAAMLKAAGCQYVLVGHSERRLYHGEGEALLREKVRQVQSHGMTPIVCVGETLEEKKQGGALPFVTAQIRALALSGSYLLAYEPRWAIGTGLTAGLHDIQDIQSVLKEQFGAPVLYGGSVNAENAPDILALPAVDGVLVGGASLDIEAFSKIIESTPK